MAYEAQNNAAPGPLSDVIILSVLNSTVATLAFLLFLKYARHVPTSDPLLLQCLLPGMPLLPLILISTYMTSPRQENLLQMALQNSKPLHNSWSIMSVLLYSSQWDLSVICPPPAPRGVPEPVPMVKAVVYTAFQLCVR